MIKSSFCSGTVIHNRMLPKKHRFKYAMSWCLLDLDKIEELFNSSVFWSLNKFNLISIRNKDYVNTQTQSINVKIRDYIKTKTHQNFEGKVFLFTHPRYLGYGFNSVNFYFCFLNNEIKYIVSEINNTPWKQKHLYFHDVQSLSDTCNTNAANELEFNFKKEFHISPFVDMEINYNWKFMISDKNIKILMQLNKQDSMLMNIILDTKLKNIENNKVLAWTFKKPFQALKMKTGIYWQALKLGIKRIPFYSHPKADQNLNNQPKP